MLINIYFLTICLLSPLSSTVLASDEPNTKPLDNLLKSYSFVGQDGDNYVNSNISGIVKLCLDSEPDGAAVIDSETTQVILVFKVDNFWVIEVNEFVNKVYKIDGSSEVFKADNQLSTGDFWPEHLSSPDWVLSFTNLNKSDPFYNNVLVFKERILHRYAVEAVNLKMRSSILKVKLISKHISETWAELTSFNDISLMTIISGTYVVYVQGANIFGLRSAYILNPANMDNPIEHRSIMYSIPNSTSSSIYASYILLKDKTISFNNGQICVSDNCISLRKLMVCDPRITAFTRSYAYWLWRESALNIRLIVVALCSIMVINLILAVSFIIHQVQRVADLT